MRFKNYSERELAKKIKMCERSSEAYIDVNKDCFIRLDGKRFSKFTKGFKTPFDDVLREVMKKTMLRVCNEVQGTVMGYTQSDEITVYFKKMSDESEIMFSGRIQKIVSEMAATASVAFNEYLFEIGEKSDTPEFYRKKYFKAIFDCRVFNYDDDPMEVFIWRCLDCEKNAIQMVARSHFSHKELKNKKLIEMKQMLLDKGINIDDINPNYIYGVATVKEQIVVNKGTDRECNRNKFVFKNALEVL